MLRFLPFYKYYIVLFYVTLSLNSEVIEAPFITRSTLSFSNGTVLTDAVLGSN